MNELITNASNISFFEKIEEIAEEDEDPESEEEIKRKLRSSSEPNNQISKNLLQIEDNALASIEEQLSSLSSEKVGIAKSRLNKTQEMIGFHSEKNSTRMNRTPFSTRNKILHSESDAKNANDITSEKRHFSRKSSKRIEELQKNLSKLCEKSKISHKKVNIKKLLKKHEISYSTQVREFRGGTPSDQISYHSESQSKISNPTVDITKRRKSKHVSKCNNYV